jgi:hypothetical protein
MHVAPGLHHIRIALPGWETFQTDINPLPRQKVEGKTDLVKSEVPASTGVAVAVASEAAVCASSVMDIDVGRFYRDLESCCSKSARYISSSYMHDRFLV